MVSSELARARELHKLQAKTYKDFKSRQQQLKEQGYVLIDRKPTAKREDLLAHARAEYEQHMASLQEDAAAIRERAAKRKTVSTPESRAKVEKMLSTGWSLQDCCEQLILTCVRSV